MSKTSKWLATALMIGVFAQPGLAEAQWVSTDSLLSVQRNNYRSNQWDSFFGTAQAYRQSVWQKAPEPELVLLEALALIKFCRYPEAAKLVRGLYAWIDFPENSERRDPGLVSRLGRTEALLVSLDKLALVVPKGESPARGAREVLWPMRAAEEPVKQGIPVTAFRAHVESRCK